MRAAGRCAARALLVLANTNFACRGEAADVGVAAVDPASEERTPIRSAGPGGAEHAATQREHDSLDQAPVLDGGEGGRAARPGAGTVRRSGEGAASSLARTRTRECPGPVFLRVRNASKTRFDSVSLREMEFGSLRAGAKSKYQLAEGCVYRYVRMAVTSGKQRFVALGPIDLLGLSPLAPGYYTHALTTQPTDDSRYPGDLHSELSRDSTTTPAK